MTAVAAPRRPLFARFRHDPILVCGKRIRGRLAQQTAWSFAAANAGALVISAIYYMLTQWHWHVGSVQLFYLKPGWDGLFKTAWWPVARHDVRDVYESVLATLFVKSLLANWRKAHGTERVGAFRIATAPLAVAVAALPLVAAGIWVINFGAPWLWHKWLHHHVITWHVALPGWLSTYLTTWNWQPVLIGIAAGLVVHRLYRPVGNTVQLVFIERGIQRYQARLDAWTSRHWDHGSGCPGRPQYPVWVRFPLTPPVVRERFCDIIGSGRVIEKHGRALGFVAPAIAVAFLALAVYGGIVRYVFAAATKTPAAH